MGKCSEVMDELFLFIKIKRIYVKNKYFVNYINII